MDIRQRITEFLRQYQTTGWLIALMVGGLLLQGLLYLIFSAAGGTELYTKVIESLALPPQFSDWVYAPWSIVTYPFFSVDFDILEVLFSGLILWTFGRVHQQLLGEQRTRRLVILGIPLIGLLTLTITSIAGYQYTPTSSPFPSNQVQREAMIDTTDVTENASEVGVSSDGNTTPSEEADSEGGIPIGIRGLAYVSGMIAIIMILVISCISLVPDYPVQLFLFGQVKIVWVGLVLFLLTWGLWASFFTPLGIAIVLGGLLGFLHVYMLRNGTDITEKIWAFYADSGSKPRMKVKYGNKSTSSATTRPKSTRKAKEGGKDIPQEIIDGILDKISEKGYDSLTREEKELLFKASTQKDDVD